MNALLTPSDFADAVPARWAWMSGACQISYLRNPVFCAQQGMVPVNSSCKSGSGRWGVCSVCQDINIIPALILLSRARPNTLLENSLFGSSSLGWLISASQRAMSFAGEAEKLRRAAKRQPLPRQSGPTRMDIGAPTPEEVARFVFAQSAGVLSGFLSVFQTPYSEFACDSDSFNVESISHQATSTLLFVKKIKRKNLGFLNNKKSANP